MHVYQTVVRGHLILAHTEIPDGYVAIDQGKVARIGAASAGLPAAETVYDHRGSYVFPAAIDAQVHSRSQLNQEDFIWSTRSAAAGGVGTIIDMPYDSGRLICDAERFELKKQEAQAQARVDFALYGTVHPDEGASKIDEIVAAGAIGFKFSTFGTDPERFPRIPPKTMHECFAQIAKHGLFGGVHNEDDETIKTLTAEFKAAGITDYTAHAATRPIYAENLAIHQIYELGADTGCRTHVVHCSNKRGYDICQSYQQQGFPTTIEACLHYMVLSEDEDVARLGGRAKVNPPIRPQQEREGLWQHLAAGNITVVSTDHVSWSLDRKTHANIFDNASGATGLALLLPLMIHGAAKRGISLTRIAQVLAYNPARLFSLQHQKGALELGCDADLAIVRKEPYQYDAKASGHNFADWSPYDGLTIDYQVSATMLRGQWIFANEQVLSEPGSGQFVRPAHTLPAEASA
ncbi:dihydroorotase family protein [Neisseriaceae bacterium CLB008]